MEIKKIQGSHTPDDRLILITTEKEEAIKIRDVYDIVEAFARNELARIRVPFVRYEIIYGERPFMFEDLIKSVFTKVKKEMLK